MIAKVADSTSRSVTCSRHLTASRSEVGLPAQGSYPSQCLQAIPVRPTVLVSFLLSFLHESSCFVHDVGRGVHVPVMPNATVRACPFADMQVLRILIAVSAIGA